MEQHELGIDFLYDDSTATARCELVTRRLLRRAFRAGGRWREAVVVANKLWFEMWPEQAPAVELDAGLQRLGFDYLARELDRRSRAPGARWRTAPCQRGSARPRCRTASCAPLASGRTAGALQEPRHESALRAGSEAAHAAAQHWSDVARRTAVVGTPGFVYRSATQSARPVGRQVSPTDRSRGVSCPGRLAWRAQFAAPRSAWGRQETTLDGCYSARIRYAPVELPRRSAPPGSA
jgi:hypothetical protein